MRFHVLYSQYQALIVTATLDTVILFVHDVELLAEFYVRTFHLQVTEQHTDEWRLLRAGAAHLGLHRIGIPFRDSAITEESNSKIVFEIDEDIHQVHQRLTQQGVRLREVQTFPGSDYWFCDGQDPEGNVFQLKQRKRS